MNLCLVHIRISVAPGETVPDITYTSRLLETEDNSRQKFNSLADFHANALAGMEYSNISPMKPSKTKAEQPKEIILESMTEEEKKDIAQKLQGQRTFREITVETYEIKKSNPEDTGPVGANGQSENLSKDNLEESKGNDINELPKKSEAKKFQKSSKKARKSESDDDSTDRRSYAEAVTVTTQELLRRSSNSVSSSKDDYELSEILHMSAAVASATSSSRPSSSLERSTPTSRPGSEMHSGSPALQTAKVPFFSGNPAVELTHGIIHLYKTNFMLSVNEDLSPPPTNTLCMLAVPGTIDAHTILEFTAAFCDTITRLRIVRDRTPSQYMALITFSDETSAADFYHSFNNVPFSSLMQDEVCHLAFVASVEALPILPDKSKNSFSDTAGLLPIPESTELPDCVLCLERMDESVHGVLTILCNHSFHGSCLQKWEDLCCPVCRYIQTPEPRTDNKCLVCGNLEDLWICLVCGHVGCGRYTTEHAQQHYNETHHNYAMALNDNRVWDYAGDYFVHRLFQNKEDGKLVEQKAPHADDEERAFKVEAIQLECMYLLTSQLDSQRKYWEEKLADVTERSTDEMKEAQSQLSEAIERCKTLDFQMSALVKEKQTIEKKNQHLSSKYAESLRDLSTEKELNHGLRKNQDDWREKVKQLEDVATSQQQEIGELKEQLRDVMFYLEAQKTFNEADEETREEAQSGQILVGASGSQRRKRKTKK